MKKIILGIILGITYYGVIYADIITPDDINVLDSFFNVGDIISILLNLIGVLFLLISIYLFKNKFKKMGIYALLLFIICLLNLYIDGFYELGRCFSRGDCVVEFLFRIIINFIMLIGFPLFIFIYLLKQNTFRKNIK